LEAFLRNKGSWPEDFTDCRRDDQLSRKRIGPLVGNEQKKTANNHSSQYKTLNIMALELTDTNFQDKVISSEKLTVVDFWAEWCGPCRAIGPVIEELSKEYDGKINVGKVNVDHNPQLSINYGITSIPAILFIKGGKVVDKLVGAQPKSNFVKKIEQHV
jgi:thioredoxin 1